MAYPPPVERLVVALERLPGIGRRTAERLTFHLLAGSEASGLMEALREASRETVRCGECGNLSACDPCAVCGDPERDAGTVLVLESPRDVEAVERAGVYRGRYHVLMGAFDPARGVHEAQLAIEPLLARLRSGGVRELILGTDADAEGEATARLLLEAVGGAGLDITTTRLARGLPAGSAIEYLHKGVLEDALEGRSSIRLRHPPTQGEH